MTDKQHTNHPRRSERRARNTTPTATSCGSFPLCEADLNLDGLVDEFDFGLFVQNSGQCDPLFTWRDGDLNGDGCVDVLDNDILAGAMANMCYPDEIAYDYRDQMVRYVDNVGEDLGS